MRLISFLKLNEIKIGIVINDGHDVIDLSIASPDLPRRMNELINLGKRGLNKIDTIVSNPPSNSLYQFNDLELLAPIPKPTRNIFCSSFINLNSMSKF